MLYGWILFAQAVEEGAKKDADGPPVWGPLPMLAMIAVAAYFLLILPGRKEKQQRQAMMSALKKNDRVITSGGIVGVVVNLKEGTEEVTIRSEDAKLLILRSAIARIINEPEKDSSTQVKPAT
jgi:preprotein translocase subunit YajC